MTASPFATLDDLDVDNRRVLVRVDFNVPLTGDGQVRDDTRIRGALPTLTTLRERGAKLVVCSHLGRPKGKVVPSLSLEPVGARLAELLSVDVKLADEVVGDGVTKLVTDARAGEVVLLENLRFSPGETSNDPKLAQALAALADAYVCDAFGACHRAHASVVGVPQLVGERAAGRLLEAELRSLSRLVTAPQRPFVAIVGGAKVSDKLGVLMALVERLAAGDTVVIGGAMANTFLAASGRELGASLMERERQNDARIVMTKAAARDIRVILPTDLLVGEGIDAPNARLHDVLAAPLGDAEMALDIGPATAKRCAAAIADAAMVLWNGPMGLFENPAFAEGTLAVARAVADCPGYCVVGGGDSVAAVSQSGVADRIDHVSTGGGASLEFIEGKTLPGVAALHRTQD
ncbi:MAG: phosphoglycerate kinase [Deltaproteobacteria bacterium]|nr:phosphoglycerate kinase [Deltaproteobacteria bacterium]